MKKSTILIIVLVVLLTILLTQFSKVSYLYAVVSPETEVPGIIGSVLLDPICPGGIEDYKSIEACGKKTELYHATSPNHIHSINFLGETFGEARAIDNNPPAKFVRDDQFFKAYYDDSLWLHVQPKFIENNIFEVREVSYNYIQEELPYLYKDIEPKLITIKLYSNYPKTLNDIELFVWLEDTLGIAGMNIIDLSRRVNINPGLNEFVFELPEGLEIQEYSFKFFFSEYGQTGWEWAVGFVPFNCGDIKYNLGHYRYGGPLMLTEIYEDKFLIAPKPTYLTVKKGESCREGYEFQIIDDLTSDTICVRSDLKGLPCMVLGVPVTVNFTYICSSSGMPVEFLFQPMPCETDADCGPNKICEIESKVCWNAIIYENIIQCKTDADCTTPCVGVIPKCISNKCKWEGECTSVVQEVECKLGEKWDYKSRPICKGVTVECTDGKWVFKGECKPIIPVYLIGSFVLLIIMGIIVYFGFIRKKK